MDKEKKQPVKCQYGGCNAWAMKNDVYCKSHKALYLSKIESGSFSDSAYWDKLPDTMKSDYNTFMGGEPLQLSDEIAVARTLLKEYLSTIGQPESDDAKAMKDHRWVIQNGMKLIDTLSKVVERFRKIQMEGIKLDVKISVDMLQLYLQQCIFPFIQDFETKKKIAEASRSFSLDSVKRGRIDEQESFDTIDLDKDDYHEEEEPHEEFEDFEDIVKSLTFDPEEILK